ncbi:HAMP domain-containing protein [Leptolyngbya sp. FACHB-711]|nr:HAMP domain-containing protein [Leptolyngbya sp. FACHB-711]
MFWSRIVGKQLKAKIGSRQGIPLQVILVVPFVLQIFAAVGLTGYLSIRNGQRAINDLAVQLQRSVSNRINQHLDDFIFTGRQIAQLNAKAIELKALNPEDLDLLGRYFWQQMQVYNLGYINLVSESGNFIGVGRFERNSPVTIDILSPQRFGNNDVYIYQVNSQGEPATLDLVNKTFDFKQEPWYQQTVEQKKPIWNLFQWIDPPYHLSLAATYPIYDANDRLKYISWTELRTWEISSFLRQLSVSTSGRTFILERNGLLVGSSADEEPYRLVNNKPQRLRGTESRDPLIQASVQYMQQQFQDLSQIKSQQQLEFWQNGQRQFLQVTPWSDAWGLDWLVVVAVPEADFMGQIQDNTRITIWLCLIALGTATLLGIYTSRWIAQPIARLNVASRAIAAGELDLVVQPDHVREFEELAHSFNQMAQQLRDSFRALESANHELEQTNADLENRVHQRTLELSEALRDLQQTQAQLIQTEKMSSLGQMVAGVAHEINNPVNFIHGNLNHAKSYVEELLTTLSLYQKHYAHPATEIQQYAEEIDLAFLMQDAPQMLESMQEGTRRIREIVTTLRNFSRLDEAETKQVDLNQGIDSTLLILKYRFKAKHEIPEIRLVKHYANLPLTECYAGQINQVFMNILTNALDAIDQRNSQMTLQEVQQNPGQVTISTELDKTQQVIVRISDNGMGIPESIKGKLFDPFFTTKPVGKGTGLGLSICYQIVVGQHGGKLDYISTPGVGTEFIIAIPLVAVVQ